MEKKLKKLQQQNEILEKQTKMASEHIFYTRIFNQEGLSKTKINFDEKFKIISAIGKGSYGAVFKCKYIDNNDSKHEKIYALKMIFNMNLESTSIVRDRNAHEYNILWSIKESHPNINFIIGEFCAKPTEQIFNFLKCAEFDACRNDKTNEWATCSFFVMEYHPCNLLEKLEELQIQEVEHNGSTVKVRSKYAHDILSAIQFLYKHRIAHSDMKLRNMLVSENDDAILCDFGESILLDHNYENFPAQVNTDEFTAPEIRAAALRKENCQVNFKSNFAFEASAAIYNICFFNPPFAHDDISKSSFIKPPNILAEKFSSDLLELLEAGCQSDPKDRISFEDFAEKLPVVLPLD